MWTKKGLIIGPSGKNDWRNGGTSACCVDFVNEDLVEIYLTGRDEQNRSRIGTFLYHLCEDKIVDIEKDAILDLGERGTFDFNGTGYPCVVKDGEETRMYYTGWTKGVHVSFINDLGLAVKSSGQSHFKRFSRASILPRTNDEPFGTGSVFVLQDEGLWKMWYTCFDYWGNESAGDDKHYYHIRYAESTDGINWIRPGITCIDFDKINGEYVVARPCVLKYKGLYLMWYSYRGDAYKMGFAVSLDGKNWNRHDNESGLSASAEGWDSDMVCYAWVIQHRGEFKMFYNGNGYGRTGLGQAVCAETEMDACLFRLGYKLN